MSSFLTQCPHCLTSFRVTEKQLDAAEGLVRCGACLGIFSAAANRITVKAPPEERAVAAEDVLLDEELDAELDAELDDDEEADEEIAEEVDAGTELEVDEESDDDIGDETPAAEPDEDTEPEEDINDEDDSEHFAAASPEPDDEDVVPDELLLVDGRDFDIPLGDLKLDGDDFAEEEDDEEDEDDTEVDDALEDEALDEEYDEVEDEEEEEEEEEEIYEEYTDEAPAAAADEEADTPDYADEFEPEFVLEDDDEEAADENAEEDTGYEVKAAEDQDEAAADEDDEAAADEYAYELEEDEDPPVVTPRTSFASSDKSRLRNYLADISDDEALDPIDDDALEDLDEPVLLDAAPRRSRLATAGFLCAILVFTALLAWQYVAANIERLSRSVSFAPLLPYACRVLDCPAPQRAQPDLFMSEQLLVRAHPEYAEALEVNLVFRNDATEAQPFPALELGLHDSANRLIANRLFAPAEYLPPELQTSEMPAQSSLQVTLELVDPGSDAVNYTLAFRAP